jgi:hypothetical protein
MALHVRGGRLAMALATFAVAAVMIASCTESGLSGPPPIKIGTLLASRTWA